VLGLMPQSQQPSQKAFETGLWDAMRRFDPARPVFVESESRRVGRCHVPDALIAAMSAGECVWLDVPLAARVAHIAGEYAHFVADPQAMMARLQPLKALRGARQLQEWQTLADRGDTDALFASLMTTHYDPLYTSAIRRHFTGLTAAPVVALVDLSARTLDAAARALRDQFDPD